LQEGRGFRSKINGNLAFHLAGVMKEYFEISIRDLQIASKWAVESAESVLEIFEKNNPDDYRPRNAIEGAKSFVICGIRTITLRKLALDAFRASKETNDMAASFAANAASLAAATAFTHPYKDVRQAEHILGPVVFSALSSENNTDGKEDGGNEIKRAIDRASKELALFLAHYPERQNGKKRIHALYHELDQGIRMKYPHSQD
jgi:hypothetical protein